MIRGKKVLGPKTFKKDGVVYLAWVVVGWASGLGLGNTPTYSTFIYDKDANGVWKTYTGQPFTNAFLCAQFPQMLEPA